MGSDNKPGRRGKSAPPGSTPGLASLFKGLGVFVLLFAVAISTVAKVILDPSCSDILPPATLPWACAHGGPKCRGALSSERGTPVTREHQIRGRRLNRPTSLLLGYSRRFSVGTQRLCPSRGDEKSHVLPALGPSLISHGSLGGCCRGVGQTVRAC